MWPRFGGIRVASWRHTLLRTKNNVNAYSGVEQRHHCKPANEHTDVVNQFSSRNIRQVE
jgi:hypothetical protein